MNGPFLVTAIPADAVAPSLAFNPLSLSLMPTAHSEARSDDDEDDEPPAPTQGRGPSSLDRSLHAGDRPSQRQTSVTAPAPLRQRPAREVRPPRPNNVYFDEEDERRLAENKAREQAVKAERKRKRDERARARAVAELSAAANPPGTSAAAPPQAARSLPDAPPAVATTSLSGPSLALDISAAAGVEHPDNRPAKRPKKPARAPGRKKTPRAAPARADNLAPADADAHVQPSQTPGFTAPSLGASYALPADPAVSAASASDSGPVFDARWTGPRSAPPVANPPVHAPPPPPSRPVPPARSEAASRAAAAADARMRGAALALPPVVDTVQPAPPSPPSVPAPPAESRPRPPAAQNTAGRVRQVEPSAARHGQRLGVRPSVVLPPSFGDDESSSSLSQTSTPDPQPHPLQLPVTTVVPQTASVLRTRDVPPAHRPSRAPANAECVPDRPAQRLIVFITAAGYLPASFVRTEMFIVSYPAQLGIPHVRRILKIARVLPDSFSAARALLQHAYTTCPSVSVYSSDTLPASVLHPNGPFTALDLAPPDVNRYHGKLIDLLSTTECPLPILLSNPADRLDAYRDRLATESQPFVPAVHLFLSHFMLHDPMPAPDLDASPEPAPSPAGPSTSSNQHPSTLRRAAGTPDDPMDVDLLPDPPVRAGHSASGSTSRASDDALAERLIRKRYAAAVEDIAYCSELTNANRRAALLALFAEGAIDLPIVYGSAFASYRISAQVNRVCRYLSLVISKPSQSRSVTLGTTRTFSVTRKLVCSALGVPLGTWSNQKTRFRDLDVVDDKLAAAIDEPNIDPARLAALEELRDRLSFFLSDVGTEDPRQDPDAYADEFAVVEWKTADFEQAIDPWRT
ncbi:hypothetical protein AURDEDRAFT_168085 [Auricularia subglabra TFB-10046 SS5]|nr:hypothetical protein AURDEDRAFT_168085 [Auricularia subglabra TFB-10046 SS5]